MAITIGTAINRVDGTKQVSFSQSAAGAADEVVADPGDGYRIVVISILAAMSVAGTLALKSAANPITGAIDLGAGVPFGWKGSIRQPFVECNSSESLVLSTVTGASKGVIVYKIVQSNQA
jgi:hypothetical protein